MKGFSRELIDPVLYLSCKNRRFDAIDSML